MDTERFLAMRGVQIELAAVAWEEDAARPGAAIAGLLFRRQGLQRVAGVYFLFSGRELLYIGMSRNVLGRVHGRHTELGADGFAYIEAPEHELAALKARCIREFAPQGVSAAVPRRACLGPDRPRIGALRAS